MNAIINFWFIQKFYIEGYTVYIKPIISIAIIIIMIIIIIKRKLYSTYKTQKKTIRYKQRYIQSLFLC